MEQQIAKIEESTAFKSLKERVDTIREDANTAFSAARHDYQEVVKAMRSLQAKSELRAFVTSRLKGEVVAKPAAKKAKTTKAKVAVA